jgi:hypothetical protein
MELNFDKEMDALLRQAARSGEVVSTNAQSHLDADEISAFAENALPEKTREFYIKHFADCDRCRTILSNTILLNQEAEIETASSAVTATVPEVIETKIPWYRKMFLMPNLTYTMGALVLVVGGMLGFLVLQNLNQGLSNVAQTSANRSAERGPNAAEDQSIYQPGESNTAVSNAANMMSNTSVAATNSTTAANANTSVSTANSASSLPLTEQTKTGEDESRDSKNERKENDFLTDGASGAENRALAKATEEKADDKQRVARQGAVTDSVVTAAPPPKPASQATPPPPAKDNDAESEKLTGRTKKALKRENFTKQISGKTFNRVNGVWIDSAYNKYDGVSSNAALPPTKNIRRGSNEYRKLDRQVRIIAESFDGPVIIVWKDGAYRIQ